MEVQSLLSANCITIPFAKGIVMQLALKSDCTSIKIFCIWISANYLTISEFQLLAYKIKEIGV